MPKRQRSSSQTPTGGALAAPANIGLPPTVHSVLGPGANAQYLPSYLISRGIDQDDLPPRLMGAYHRHIDCSASRVGRRDDACTSSSGTGAASPKERDHGVDDMPADDYEIMARVVVSPSRLHGRNGPNSRPSTKCNESLEAIVDESIRHLVRNKTANTQDMDGSYGRNILSLGYVPAKEGHDGAAVPNMASGVYCVHPNSTALYARTSLLMRSLHRLVGDSILKDILTTCIVLIPAGKVGQTMRRGNYFQLCGSPLTYYKPTPAMQSSSTEDVDGVEAEKEGAVMEISCSSPKKKRVKFNEAVRCSQFNDSPGGSQTAMPANPYLKMTLKEPASSSNHGEASADSAASVDAVEEGASSTGMDCPQLAENFDPNAPIPRHLIFYSETFVKRPGLPPSHVLNGADDGRDLGGITERLLDSMVRLRVPTNHDSHAACKKKRSSKRRNRWKKLKKSGIYMCKELRRRHQQCDYARLLERHCPLPADFKPQNDSPNAPTLADLSASFVTGDQVASFVASCLSSAFPAPFWGSQDNFDVIISTATKFIKLRRREQMPEGELLHGVKVTNINWFFGIRAHRSLLRSNHEAGTRLLRNVMHWLYCSYIIPLLRSCFYATETEFTANRVVFYRKPVWTQFRKIAMATLKECQYTEIDISEAARRNTDQVMGCSKLRLLPKATGVRALNLLSHAQRVKFCDESSGQTRPLLCRPTAKDRRMSTNSTLRRTFSVLKHEHRRSPSSFGCGVFGLNEVFPLFLNFKKEVREFRAQSKQNAPLYFVSVDLHRCYDNIDQTYLHNLVKRVIINEEYLIQQHNVLHPFQSMGKVQRKRSTHLCDPVDIQSFPDIASQELAGNYSQCIFVDGITTSLVKKDEVLELLKEHIFSNLVAINGDYGPRFLSQSSGIPQGSVLSTMLCNYYYGDLESRLLGDMFAGEERKSQRKGVGLLVRIVDDFLLISTKKEVCVQFLERMRQGIPELGVRINQAKTMASFDYDISQSPESEEATPAIPVEKRAGKSSNDEGFFAWCGMIFNTKTCEARVDYSRFAGSLAVDGLTVDRLNEQGTKLIFRMKSFVRPRCQPLFFDMRLNTVENALLNFYQAMLLGAVKTVGYVCIGMSGGAKHNPQFIVKCIEDVILYAQALISSRLKAAPPSPSRDKPCGEGDVTRRHLTLSAAEWLGRHAFRAVIGTVDPCHGFGDVLGYLSKRREANDKDSATCDSALLCKVANRGLHEFDLGRFDY